MHSTERDGLPCWSLVDFTPQGRQCQGPFLAATRAREGARAKRKWKKQRPIEPKHFTSVKKPANEADRISQHASFSVARASLLFTRPSLLVLIPSFAAACARNLRLRTRANFACMLFIVAPCDVNADYRLRQGRRRDRPRKALRLPSIASTTHSSRPCPPPTRVFDGGRPGRRGAPRPRRGAPNRIKTRRRGRGGRAGAARPPFFRCSAARRRRRRVS